MTELIDLFYFKGLFSVLGVQEGERGIIICWRKLIQDLDCLVLVFIVSISFFQSLRFGFDYCKLIFNNLLA